MSQHRIDVGFAIAALAVGVGIGFIDSRPTWDDTGITVASLAIVGIALGFSRPLRWWTLALLLGCPVPAFALITGGNAGAFAAVVVALLATGGGAMARRAVAPGSPGHTP